MEITFTLIWLTPKIDCENRFCQNRRTKVPKIISMKFCRIIKILINHYFTWFLSTCKQLQPCLVPGCLLVINYKSRYSRRHSHKRRNNYTSNGILFTLANNKNSNLRETEPRSLAILAARKKPIVYHVSFDQYDISISCVVHTYLCKRYSKGRVHSLAGHE